MSEEKQMVVNEEKIKELMKDEKFVGKMLDMKTPEEVQEALAKKGMKFSLDEVELMGRLINKVVEKGTTNLRVDDLESVSGGHPGGIEWLEGAERVVKKGKEVAPWMIVAYAFAKRKEIVQWIKKAKSARFSITFDSK